VWNTAAGKMSTHGKVRVTFTLPELSPSASVDTTVHVHDGHLSRYDMIIGSDLLKDFGIDVLFSTSTIEWTQMNASIPMKPHDFSFEEDVYITNSLAVEADSDRLSSILDSKYAPTDIARYVSEQKALLVKERLELFNVMKAYEGLFYGTLGQWTGEPHHIELIPDAKPYHAWPYSMPKAYKQTLKLELDRLVKIGILK
jgi:hypothetical protein